METSATPTHALIVDDHAEARAWLLAAVAQAYPGAGVAEAGTLSAALEQLRAAPFDCVLLDLALPDGSGLKALEWLREHRWPTACVITTAFDDDEHVFGALRLGARGYVLKDESRDTLAALLKGMLLGQPPLSPAVARRVLAHFHAPSDPVAKALSPREREVLQLVAKGLSVPRAAQLLELSPYTVQDHVKRIYEKLEVGSRAEALLLAKRLGLV